MAAIAYDMEVTSSIPACKIYKAFVLNVDSFVPKILPATIKSVETIKVDEGVGSIKTSQLKSMKHRVDGFDKENFTYNYSLIQREALMGELESITYHINIVPSVDGGLVCKNRSM
ncbi:hypothetical protein RJ640_024428 [Escallonia rubra]|uniref:Bet v I/Major latex protein domain-containing protein n=1 Tax=Escallonia rubra TaxID=112253 RepID=A0AA88RRG8_9ASTE|nr:hypothetical protein RJ640_024428 [Escallonia rubra]